MENKLFRDYGTWATVDGKAYSINKVVIFKDNKEMIFANYFIDNFTNGEYKIIGETKKKNKVDLTLSYNFIIKSENQDSWRNETQYTLYLNGDLQQYNSTNLKLNGECLEIEYYLQDNKCSQCIGWNQKESNKIKYEEFEKAYKNINRYTIESELMEENIKNLLKTYKKYKKAKEIEKTYTAQDYLKMNLSSGTPEQENKTMLKNNGWEI